MFGVGAAVGVGAGCLALFAIGLCVAIAAVVVLRTSGETPDSRPGTDSERIPDVVAPGTQDGEPAEPLGPATDVEDDAASLTPLRSGSDHPLVGEWRGTAEVITEYYAPCGADFSWVHYDTRTVTYPVEVSVTDPTTDDFNPVFISVTSDLPLREMSFSIVSSARFSTSSGPLTLQYWDVSVMGEEIRGELVDPHRDEAAVLNMVHSDKPWDPCSDRLGSFLTPLSIDAGATMSGRFGTESGVLEIQGRTFDSSRAFVVNVNVTRD